MKPILFLLVLSCFAVYLVGCAPKPKYDWGGLARGVEQVREEADADQQ